MRTLYLIRHTQPDIRPELCYGQLDIDVTDDFAAQASLVAARLPELELVISSPLLRTRKLAAFIAPQGALRLEARLMEKHFGIWEGLAWDDIPRRQIDDWATDIMAYAPPGGESAQQLMQRVGEWLRELENQPEATIALVTHAGVIRAILSQLANIPLAHTLHWQIDYGAVIAVRI